MQTREYRTIDKSSWGNGPWKSEPDKKQWKDGATGLPCLVVRGRSGALCGYVGVLPGHPAYGLDYSFWEYDENWHRIELTPAQSAINEITVHGGLTFARECAHSSDESTAICHVPEFGEADNVWWFGFDCAHADDLCPRRNPDLPIHLQDLAGPRNGWRPEVRYRTLEYVEAQCALLAAQLVAIS